MKLEDYLHIVRARWLIVAACVVLVTAGAVAASILTPPKYVATTRLFVTVASDTWLHGGVDDVYQGGMFAQQRAITYTEMLTSQNVLQRTIDALGLDMKADELAGQIKPSLAPESVLINLRVEDGSAERAARIANELADQFADVASEVEQTDRQSNPTATIIVAQPAVAPDLPFSPKKKLNVALGMIVGLLLGIGLAVLRDRLDKSVKTVREIENLTNSTVIAKLPGPDRPGRDASLPSGATDSTLEAYRDLGTHMIFSDVDTPPRSFIITSPDYHEDRARMAINLAVVLGSAQREVALVDADFRSHRATTDFDFDDADGLSGVLAISQPLDLILQRSSFSGVTVLPSGPIPPNPSALLSSQSAEMLFKDLRGRFDFVVFDGPPLLPYTDATLVAKQTDGAILIVQPYVTSRDQLVDAVAKLAGVNAKLLGVVTTSPPRRGLARLFRRRPKGMHSRRGALATEDAVRSPAPTSPCDGEE